MLSGCFAFDFRVGVADLLAGLCFRGGLVLVYCCLLDLLFGLYLDAGVLVCGLLCLWCSCLRSGF